MGSFDPHSADRRRQYCFGGGFTLDLDAGFLRCGGEEVALRPKSFEVLAYLVEHHGRLVSREELMRAVWPDVAVTDEAVTKCIADIRRAVQDDEQQLIRTAARRGYMLAASVTSPALEFPRHAGREIEYGPVPVPPIMLDAPSPGDVRPTLRAMERQIPRAGQEEGGLRRLRFNWVWAAAVTVLLLAAGISVIVFRAARPGRGNRAAASDYTQITNFTDSASSPALSPDGRMLAFIRGDGMATVSREGNIYVKLLPDGEPVQLTHDSTRKMAPIFTPGGDRIAYGVTGLMTDPKRWSTWTVSVFGGEPKLLLSNASALTWIPGASPRRVLFSEVDTGTHMSIVTSAENRTEARTAYSPAGRLGMAHHSYLSPDRKHVLIVEMDATGWLPCQVVPFESGRQQESSAGRAVGPSPGQCSSAAWSPDGEWIYLTVNTGTGYHIWRQRFPSGAPEQVTFGATEEHGAAFAPDGRSFFTSVGTRQSTLWIHDSRGERQITSEGYALLPRFSPDGRKLYFLLRSRTDRRYLNGELWSADLQTDQHQRLLPDFVLEDYSLSPDGNRVAFVAIAGNGDTSAWLGTLDGRTAQRRLSTTLHSASRVFFRADGEVFFFGREREDARFLYRIKNDGSGLQKAIPDQIMYVYDVSPDGKALAA